MKDLIILGGGESRKECPYDTEVWAVSTVLLLPDVKKECISKVFAIDKYELIEEDLGITRELDIPIVSVRDYATESYPLKEIKEEFQTTYFRNTISYTIAMAIYEGYEMLKLYGVDQGPQWNYIANRPYVMFWLGVATGRGVKWELSDSSILKHPLLYEIKKKIETDEKRATIWLSENKEKLDSLGGACLVVSSEDKVGL